MGGEGFWAGFSGVGAAVLQHHCTSSHCHLGVDVQLVLFVLFPGLACLGRAKNRSHCVFLLQNQGEY